MKKLILGLIVIFSVSTGFAATQVSSVKEVQGMIKNHNYEGLLLVKASSPDLYQVAVDTYNTSEQEAILANQQQIIKALNAKEQG